jgi:hypothetical protein
VSPEVRRAADEALWAWYVEWSKISRAAIRDARMLRVLGFGRAGRPRGAKSLSSSA